MIGTADLHAPRAGAVVLSTRRCGRVVLVAVKRSRNTGTL
jgi:hypothetical protein